MVASEQRISVCLPIYNGGKYLAEAIESVLAQSHKNFELLVSDDRSNDSSAEIVRKYANQDGRIVYWCNESNLGIFANYNECIKRATGSIIKLFAQDDVLEPNCLAVMLEQLLANDKLALITAARTVIDQHGQQTSVERFFDKTITINGFDVIRDYMRTFVYRTGTPSQVMFRKSSAGAGFNTLYTLSGDIEYFLRILQSGDFMYLDEALVRFRRHSESVTALALKNMSFVSDAFRLSQTFGHYLTEGGSSRPLIRHKLIENVIRKVNNAIYDRKIEYTAPDIADTTSGGTSEALDFEQIAYELLFYAAETKMQLEKTEHRLKQKEADLNGRNNTDNEIGALKQQLIALKASKSWRITQPFRWLRKTFD